jgi:hypothetical protein
MLYLGLLVDRVASSLGALLQGLEVDLTSQ